MKFKHLLALIALAALSSCSSSTSAPLDMKFPNALYSGNVSGLYEVIGSSSTVDISWKDSDGIVRKLSGYHGKVSIVTFWQSSLGASDTEIASADSAAREMPDSLRAIGIAIDNVTFGIGSFRTIVNYVRSHPISIQIVVDSTELAQTEFEQFDPTHTPGTPQTFVLDQSGNIARIIDGYFPKDSIEAEVRKEYK